MPTFSLVLVADAQACDLHDTGPDHETV